MNKESIIKLIKTARIKKGLTQTELANLLGVMPATINNWEAGRSYPRFTLLYRAFDILDIKQDLSEEGPVIEIKTAPLTITNLGENLKTARKLFGITQSELADVLDVKQSTVAAWEGNRAEPPIESIKKICNTFDISACELLGLVCYEENSHLYELIKMYSNLNAVGQKKLYQEAEDLLELSKYKK